MLTRLDKLDLDDFDQQVGHEGKYLTFVLTREGNGVRILRAKEVLRLMTTIPVEQDGFKDF